LGQVSLRITSDEEEEAVRRRISERLFIVIALVVGLGGVLSSLGCEAPGVPEYPTPILPSAVKIAYVHGGELWTMNLDGQEPMLVAQGLELRPEGCYPYYISPDGHQVAYQTADGQFWMADTRGPDRERLTERPVEAVSWFPDSSGLVYSFDDDIYVHWLKPPGPPRPIRTGGRRFLFPTWSPDGSYIAFLETTEAGVFSVNIVKSDGTGWRSLGTTAFTIGEVNLCPDIVAWSPDGTKLLVNYGQPAFVYYVAGGTPIQVGGGDSVSSHRWSPDGQELAFEGEGSGLWLIRVDGSEERPLVDEAIDGFAWAPGRRLIVYNTTATRGLNDLWVINVDVGEKHQLTVGDSYVELAPAWTPEGSRIVFQRVDVRGNEAGIWSVAPDGTDLQQLSSVGTAVQVFPVR